MKTLIENENFNIFEAGYFATRISVDRVLNHSGVRFQIYAVSVSGADSPFKLGRKVDSCKKSTAAQYVVSKMSGFVWISPKSNNCLVQDL